MSPDARRRDAKEQSRSAVGASVCSARMRWRCSSAAAIRHSTSAAVSAAADASAASSFRRMAFISLADCASRAAADASRAAADASAASSFLRKVLTVTRRSSNAAKCAVEVLVGRGDAAFDERRRERRGGRFRGVELPAHTYPTEPEPTARARRAGREFYQTTPEFMFVSFRLLVVDSI